MVLNRSAWGYAAVALAMGCGDSEPLEPVGSFSLGSLHQSYEHSATYFTSLSSTTPTARFFFGGSEGTPYSLPFDAKVSDGNCELPYVFANSHPYYQLTSSQELGLNQVGAASLEFLYDGVSVYSFPLASRGVVPVITPSEVSVTHPGVVTMSITADILSTSMTYRLSEFFSSDTSVPATFTPGDGSLALSFSTSDLSLPAGPTSFSRSLYLNAEQITDSTLESGGTVTVRELLSIRLFIDNLTIP